jgi:phytoene synthase
MRSRGNWCGMSIEACAGLVQRGDPDRYSALMAMPRAVRADLLPLFALNLEVARAPWASKEAMICEMRLQWWRDVITEPTPRAHEVAAPLHDLIRRKSLPIDLLDRMITARIWDIYSDPFADEAAFWKYLDDTSGGLYWASALILGAGDEVSVRKIGIAAGLANYLRAVPELEKRGRRPLVDGRPDAVRALAQQALNGMGRAKGPAILPAYQARGLLRQVIDNPMIVANGQMGLSEFDRRRRLAWAALTGRV